MSASTAKVLVLGLGNDVLTDDAVGLQVADAVQERLAEEPDIEVKSTMEMGLALLDEMAGRESLILVDSLQTGREPLGHIHEFSFADGGKFPLGPPLFTSPHFVGVGDTLALGHLLGLPMPRAVLIFGIEVADPFTLGTILTPEVARAVGPAAERVTERARELAGAPIRACQVRIGP
jgi:hydrogenase maturation protease